MSGKKSRKLEADTSDSDSGPDDRNVPVAKKSKPSKQTTNEGEPMFSISRNRYVKVREFRGKILVDIREYYNDSEGELKPGKKGICLSAEQYQALKNVIPEVDEALKRM